MKRKSLDSFDVLLVVDKHLVELLVLHHLRVIPVVKHVLHIDRTRPHR